MYFFGYFSFSGIQKYQQIILTIIFSSIGVTAIPTLSIKFSNLLLNIFEDLEYATGSSLIRDIYYFIAKHKDVSDSFLNQIWTVLILSLFALIIYNYLWKDKAIPYLPFIVILPAILLF